MTTPVNWEELHAQAFLQLLAANADIPATFDNGVPRGNTLTTYVVTYLRTLFPSGSPQNAVDGRENAIKATATVYSTAPEIVACRILQYQVRQTLLGARPVIAGRSCGQIQQVDAQDAHRDDTTGAPLYSATSVFEFVST